MMLIYVACCAPFETSVAFCLTSSFCRQRRCSAICNGGQSLPHTCCKYCSVSLWGHYTKTKTLNTTVTQETYHISSNELEKIRMHISGCCFGYIHLHVTEVTVQVLDYVGLLCPVKKWHWTSVAPFCPHTGISWIYSHGSNMGDEVDNKCQTHQLHAVMVKGIEFQY